jgi:chorismate mutase / prephenate dehydratase
MKLEEYREKIDIVDAKLIALFTERMELSRNIAEYKKENGLPVLDASREEEKLNSVAAQSPEELREYTRRLYMLLFELSRDYQRELIGKERG